MNFFEQFLELTVPRDPCADLCNKAFGDVNRAGLAVFLVGNMLASMQRPTVMTTAGRLATAVAVRAEGSGENRSGRAEFLEAALQHAVDDRWMVGNTHDYPGVGERIANIAISSGKKRKMEGAKKSDGKDCRT